MCRWDCDVAVLKRDTFSHLSIFARNDLMMISSINDIVNQRFRDARYFRGGVDGELMLYVVSFKDAE